MEPVIILFLTIYPEILLAHKPTPRHAAAETDSTMHSHAVRVNINRDRANCRHFQHAN